MADTKHLQGEIRQWNDYLNVIYDNLSYDSKIKKVVDKSGKIIGLSFVAEHEQIFNMFEDLLTKARAEEQSAIKRRDLKSKMIAQNKIYYCIRDKSRWLRIFENDLGLYLREIETGSKGSLY